MRERSEQILKVVCLGLGLLLTVQLLKAFIHSNPLAGVAIPDLPSLPVDSNAVDRVANKISTKTGTNTSTPATDSKTNLPSLAAATNNPATNATAIASTDTNNSGPKIAASTNISLASVNTNTAAHSTATNIATAVSIETNATTSKLETGTNAVASQATNTSGTNTASVQKPSRKGGAMLSGMMAGPMEMKAASLPPDIQARIDRVTESEILGPVMHPMPMALLGIAGNSAFLRTPGGQTGLVKEGDDLGEIKLLRIGTNRVLVEENGEKKELMIFAGFGGDSLLPKPTESTNETTNRK